MLNLFQKVGVFGICCSVSRWVGKSLHLRETMSYIVRVKFNQLQNQTWRYKEREKTSVEDLVLVTLQGYLSCRVAPCGCVWTDGTREGVDEGVYDMVICMDSNISSTAFMEHLFSLVPRPASCRSEREGERQKGVEWDRDRKKEKQGEENRRSTH